MKRTMLTLACLAVLSACGGHAAKLAAHVSPPAVHTPEISVTRLAPQGSNVGVDVQVDNRAGAEFRLEWSKLVLTAPDGTAHVAYRDPAAAPYDTVSAGGQFAGGGTFQFDSFLPGRYSVAYDGHALSAATL